MTRTRGRLFDPTKAPRNNFAMKMTYIFTPKAGKDLEATLTERGGSIDTFYQTDVGAVERILIMMLDRIEKIKTLKYIEDIDVAYTFKLRGMINDNKIDVTFTSLDSFQAFLIGNGFLSTQHYAPACLR